MSEFETDQYGASFGRGVSSVVIVPRGGVVHSLDAPIALLSDEGRVSGVWSAVGRNGQTVYVSGDVTLSGDVKFGRYTELAVMDGAVVTSLDIPARVEGAEGNEGGYFRLDIGSGGTVSGAHLENVSVSVSDGGRSLNNTIVGESLHVTAGGVSIGDSLAGEGYFHAVLNVTSGASVEGVRVMSGAEVSAQSGAAINGMNCHSGSTITIANDVQLEGLVLNPGVSLNCASPFGEDIILPVAPEMPSIYDLDAPATWSAVIDDAGRTYFTDGERECWTNPPTIEPFAFVIVTSGAVLSGFCGEQVTVSVEAGGVLRESYLSGGRVEILAGGASVSNRYEAAEIAVTSSGRSTDDMVFTRDASGYANMNVQPGGVAIRPKIAGDGAMLWCADGGIAADPALGAGSYLTIQFYEEDPCFLAGSLLLTDDGERAVETLATGDSLICLEKDARVGRSITRVVRRRAHVRAGLPDDRAGYPVRVRQNAFGPGLPHSDLLVTAEHCFLFEGRFVPARMLVNGASIAYEHGILSYDYYHVELEHHAVILANGVETESYLDTGWRPGPVPLRVLDARHGCQRSWAQDAAAPLETSVAFVQPLHERLSERAVSLGMTLPQPDDAITSDPGLCLRDEAGRALPMLRRSADRVTFLVPAATDRVWLCSRTSRGCDAIGPYVDDRRELGVLVGAVHQYDSQREQTIDRHLRPVSVDGWWAFESGRGRWTGGHAAIELSSSELRGNSLLSIEILQTGRYALPARLRVSVAA